MDNASPPKETTSRRSVQDHPQEVGAKIHTKNNKQSSEANANNGDETSVSAEWAAVEASVNAFWAQQNSSDDGRQVTGSSSSHTMQGNTSSNSSKSSDTATSVADPNNARNCKKRKLSYSEEGESSMKRDKQERDTGDMRSRTSSERNNSDLSLVISNGSTVLQVNGSSNSPLFQWATLLRRRPDIGSSNDQLQAWLLEALSVSQDAAMLQNAPPRITYATSETSNISGKPSGYGFSLSRTDNGNNSDPRSSPSSGPTDQSGMTGSSRTDGSSADESSSSDQNDPSDSSERGESKNSDGDIPLDHHDDDIQTEDRYSSEERAVKTVSDDSNTELETEKGI